MALAAINARLVNGLDPQALYRTWADLAHLHDTGLIRTLSAYHDPGPLNLPLSLIATLSSLLMEGHHVQVCPFAFVLSLLSPDASVCVRIIHVQFTKVAFPPRLGYRYMHVLTLGFDARRPCVVLTMLACMYTRLADFWKYRMRPSATSFS